MDSVVKSVKSFTRKIYRKPKKSHRKKRPHLRSSSGSSHSNSSKKSSLRSPKSPGSIERRELSRKIAKSYKKLNIDTLAKQVDTLHSQTKNAFTRKNKRKTPSSPSSPIILTIRNLDTGKQKEASVVKNLDNGQYEFLVSSSSKSK